MQAKKKIENGLSRVWEMLRSGAATAGVMAALAVGIASAQVPVAPGALRADSGAATAPAPITSLFLATHALPVLLAVNDSTTALRWRPAGFPASLLPQAAAPTSAATATSNKATRPNWVRQHGLLLTGLAMIGVGTALVATGSSEASNGGCFYSPSNGNICVPPGPVWLGPRRATGVVIAGLGVPVAILS